MHVSLWRKLPRADVRQPAARLPHPHPRGTWHGQSRPEPTRWHVVTPHQASDSTQAPGVPRDAPGSLATGAQGAPRAPPATPADTPHTSSAPSSTAPASLSNTQRPHRGTQPWTRPPPAPAVRCPGGHRATAPPCPGLHPTDRGRAWAAPSPVQFTRSLDSECQSPRRSRGDVGGAVATPPPAPGTLPGQFPSTAPAPAPAPACPASGARYSRVCTF